MPFAGYLNTPFKDRKCLKALKYLPKDSTGNFHKEMQCPVLCRMFKYCYLTCIKYLYITLLFHIILN